MNQLNFDALFDSPPMPVDPVARALRVIKRDPLAFKFVTESWLIKNRDVWLMFFNKTEALRAAGRMRIGAACIYESMRYDTLVADTDKSFKLNNNYRSGLARLYNQVIDDDYFELRETTL